MVAAAAVRPASTPSVPPPPPAEESGRRMSDAIGRSQQGGPSGQPGPSASGAPPVRQPANDPSASGSGQPAPGAGDPPAGQPANDQSLSGSRQPTPDGAPPDPSASGTPPVGSPANDPGASPTGAVDSTSGAVDALKDPTAKIGELNSDGDQVVISLTAEAKGQIPVPVGNVPIGVGGKGQYGYDITVAQVGDAPPTGQNGPQPSYDVTFDKNLLAGATVEPPVPGVDPAGELNLTSADSVTMNFGNPADAGRAVRTLEQLAAAETLRDAGRAVTPGLSNPGSNPVPESDGSLSGPTPAEPLASQVGPSDQDMAFLRDNITSYTTTLGVQERGKAAVKFANLGIEPRLDGNQQISRTVELPRDGEPGRLTYTLSGDLQASTKERLTLGAQQFDQFEVGFTPQNIVDHGNVRGEVSLSWDLPPGGTDASVSGRPVPEAGALSGEGLGAPDEATAKLSFEGQSQPLTDLSRTDLQRGSMEVSVKNPAQHAGPVLNGFLSGDLRGAFGQMGQDFSVTAQSEQVRRDGVEQQHEIGFEVADVAEAKVSLIGEVGVDDVSGRRTRTWTGDDIAGRAERTPPAPPVDEPTPTETPGQLAVTPRDGLNVRAEPSLEAQEISAFQHGTFVQPTGARQTDATGREWLEVRGSDVDDRQVQGWVDGQYVQPHPKGAMDESGRVNPDLERQGYREHEVRPGDTVWDIARRDGANFRDTLELNSGHLINPGMIFPGDKVYIPGSANPPPPAAEPQPPAGELPGPSGGQSGPSGPSGPSGAPSGPTEPGPSAPSGPSGAPTAPNGPSASGNPSGSGSTPPTGPQPPRSGQPPEQNSQQSSSSDPSASGSPDATQGPAAPPAEPNPAQPQAGQRTDANGQTPDEILRQYQVPTDTRSNVTWSPGGLGGLPVIGGQVPSKDVTAGEADVLDGIFPNIGKLDAMNGAYETANKATFKPGDNVDDMTSDELNDGHQDAFRHAYWNALMGANVGDSEAARFATAHEANPDFENPAAREAMDLYNNEQGRRIAQENPDASDEELGQLTREAIERGEMVVVDQNGNLAWSDQVAFGQHGKATGGAGAPVLPPVEDASASG